MSGRRGELGGESWAGGVIWSLNHMKMTGAPTVWKCFGLRLHGALPGEVDQSPGHARMLGPLNKWRWLKPWSCEDGRSLDEMNVVGALTMWVWSELWSEWKWRPDRMKMVENLTIWRWPDPWSNEKWLEPWPCKNGRNLDQTNIVGALTMWGWSECRSNEDSWSPDQM